MVTPRRRCRHDSTEVRQIGLTYERGARAAGDVKYTLRKLLELAFNRIFSFSVVPLRLATYLGLMAATLSLFLAIFMFVQRLIPHWFEQFGLPYVPGFAATAISILFFGSAQLVTLGIIGEYLGRVYDEVKGRPLWTIQETLGFDQK